MSKKKVILIRTNANKDIGLGHLKRTTLLAKKFSKKYEIIFILDKYEEHVEKFNLYKKIYIYKDNEEFKIKTEIKKIKKIIQKRNIVKIIIDDYRIGYKWENYFFNKKIKIIVLDDLANRRHKCHFLIDQGWYGKNTYNRYDKILNIECIKLLGPEFNIIDSKFSNKNNKNKKNKKILIYFGGGGISLKIENFLKKFIKELKNNKFFKDTKINILIGYLNKNNNIINNSVFKSSNIKFLKNKKDINNILSETDLFIGACSSIIYKLSYLRIPSILFFLNKNQSISKNYLDDLGLIFHFKFDDKVHLKIINILSLILNFYKRIKGIFYKININLDKNGIDRIYKKIECINYKYKKKELIFKKNIYKADDGKIFKFYNARNLKNNRAFSQNSKKICYIEHSNWWFNSKIQKYFYTNKNKSILFYFWKKIVIYKSKKFYTAGFLIPNKKINLLNVLSAYKFILRKSKNLPWIGYVHKKNIFFKKINTELGFKELKKDSINQDFLMFKKS